MAEPFKLVISVVSESEEGSQINSFAIHNKRPMGKYVRDAKVAGDVAVMEVSQSTVGVRTRAKTLALQRLQSSAPPPSPDSCYLQLRSRRLEKPPAVLANSKKLHKRNLKSGVKHSIVEDEGSRTCRNSDAQFSSEFRVGSINSGSVNRSITKEGYFQETNDGNDLGIEEASFGENILDCEPRDRYLHIHILIHCLISSTFLCCSACLLAFIKYQGFKVV